MTDRSLAWDGLVNGRDLGGLPVGSGRIRTGRLFRSASPHPLTERGWDQASDAGVRTVLDLRHDFEITRHPVPAGVLPTGVRRVELPLEPPGYIERWQKRDDGWKLGTPYYYGEFLADHGDRVAAVVNRIAEAADEGGVLVHCAGGRDRCGLVVAMVLDLLGADPDTIVDDHWLSYDRAVSIEHEMGYTPVSKAPEHDPTLTAAQHRQALMAALQSNPAQSLFDSGEATNKAARALKHHLLELR